MTSAATIGRTMWQLRVGGNSESTTLLTYFSALTSTERSRYKLCVPWHPSNSYCKLPQAVHHTGYHKACGPLLAACS